jgi:hypothetical protein
VGFIMDDEVRHHKQIAEMLNDLYSVMWEVHIPLRASSVGVREDPALREQTERLLAFEKEDDKELRRLRKELRRTHHYPLLPLPRESDAARHRQAPRHPAVHSLPDAPLTPQPAGLHGR